ncbi:hypothetical protein [Beutenbergia cavernae]|nr:hypothetical protein [Beutenbergia cavernae]
MAKTPRALDVDHAEVLSRRMVWRFADLDDDGRWSLSAAQPSAMRDVLSKMRSFETMLLGELFRGEHGKRYPIEVLCSDAQRRLEELEKDDETEVVRLRCGGKERLYGLLRDHVFHVLWWDPEHEVCPSVLRNT